jgi:hypothetical protein
LKGAPTVEINATVVATATAIRIDVCVMVFIMPTFVAQRRR